MTPLRRVAMLGLAVVLTGAPGCGMFDDKPSRHDGRGGGGGGGGGDGRGGAGRGGGSHDDDGHGAAGRDDRCQVDLDQWKTRVERFKDKEYRNKSNFRQTKDDLLRDLERLDTAACRREVRHEVSDLIDQVRAEHH